MEKRAVVSLFDDVPGGGSVEQRHTIPQDGTIERVRLRNYIGHEFDLRYKVLVESKDGRERSVFTHLGKRFITGDDDPHDLDVREEVEQGEHLIIRAENDDPDHLYHANAKVSLDYEKGIMGLISGLRGLI